MLEIFLIVGIDRVIYGVVSSLYFCEICGLLSSYNSAGRKNYHCMLISRSYDLLSYESFTLPMLLTIP